MSKINKAMQVAKKAIKEPVYIKKGISHIYHYGFTGMKNKMNEVVSKDVVKEVPFVKTTLPEDVFDYDVKITIFLSGDISDKEQVKASVNSLLKQNYKNWHLVIDSMLFNDDSLISWIDGLKDSRISPLKPVPDDQYIMIMHSGDILRYDCLYEFFRAIKEENPDLIYSDHAVVVKDKEEPRLKPDWSPDLLMAQNYVGNLYMFKAGFFGEAEGFDDEFAEYREFDLLLKITEKTKNIKHIAMQLYKTSLDIFSSKSLSSDKQKIAIQNHLDRMYGEGRAVVSETDKQGIFDVRYSCGDKYKASIIIPTKDNVGMLSDVVESIVNVTEYKNYEIIVLNNNSEKQETYEYFSDVVKKYDFIRVVEAKYEFNWSKLNNHGIREASGDVYVFMNNDMKVISPDWLERLVEKAVQPGNGVVGGLLLYEDDTIQHAGVVVGMGGYADHVYKGCDVKHVHTPFISPLVTRNITACTGALMAISKETVERIGDFDEEFIICGSDIEMCIRAVDRGLKNIYDPNVKLYHYESKTRDSFIPEIDFEMSLFAYRICKEEGDMYFNECLDYGQSTPTVTDKVQFPKYESSIMRALSMESKGEIMQESEIQIPELFKFSFRKSDFPEKRLNLLVPSINPVDIFGGISTALNFFNKLVEQSGFASRIILTDSQPNRDAMKKFGDKYRYVRSTKDYKDKHQILPYNDRYNRTIPVSDNDIFVFTAWWTAYCTQEAYKDYADKGFKPNPFIYLVQDYEPGFYPWSARYLLADSTYCNQFDHIAVFNSSILYDFFKQNGYNFYKEYVFDPVLNAGLKKVLLENVGKKVNKKKQIIVYGRPTVERNAFKIIALALRKFVEQCEDAVNWEFISAGEFHEMVDLGKGKFLKSAGKMSIEEYGKLMVDTYAGISLMSSPHPSYPPLEMSTFGIKTITNNYANKDLSTFSKNIVSVKNASPSNIADELTKICEGFVEENILEIENPAYVENDNIFDFGKDIIENL